MTKRKAKSAKVAKTIVANDPEDLTGALKMIGGSNFDLWNTMLANQALQALWVRNSDAEQMDSLVKSTFAGLIGVGPKDEVEGMMAAQMIAAHNAAMECYRRAMIGDQTFEGRRENLNQATKLSRTWATMLDALNKHRGKGQQKVTVEHVHVHAGGQAVVGTIEQPGGGGQTKTEEQPHAKQIENAPEPSLRGENAGGEPVPIPRDGERPLPDARGKVSRRPNRE